MAAEYGAHGVPRIAIDATAVSSRPTGAGRVLLSLVKALPVADPGTEYVALVTEEGARALAGDVCMSEIQLVAPRQGLRWELAGAAQAAEDARADLLFTVREVVVRRTPPTVLHIFEPPAYRLARHMPTRPLLKDLLLTLLLGRSVKAAGAVTAGSATTAAWLRGRYGIEPAVVLPGLDAAFFERTTEPARRASPYLLFLATGDPREESGLLIEALAVLGTDAPLVVVAGSNAARFQAQAAEVGVGNRVEPLGWVSDEELRALYRGALAFVHPTRYEAYGGLPALEAMASGTPVIALEARGVTEALRDAAVLVDRPDPELFAAAIRTLMRDPGLRARLTAAGYERVQPLRWERAADELAAVFRRVLR
jgi:glycosyltransferase involved in cell wall biosynthesis